jgi:hypothetical protein
MLSIAYMQALLASLILIYEKKYWLGAGLTALFTSVLITQNHPQIDYYLFIAIAIMTVFYAVRWIKNKEWRHFGMVAVFTLIAASTGVLTNAVSLFSTYEYQKETIRGGAKELTDSMANKDDAKNGLSKDYALSYSMEITEPFVMILPNIYGGASDKLIIDSEKSKAWEAASQIGQQNINTIEQQTGISLLRYLPTYWGGMSKLGEAGVSGPPYVGVLICLLAIFSFFILDSKHKWWILTAIILTIVMSWGSYFESVNGLLYKYLPFYNKFRAPSMILVVSQMLIPVLAVMGLDKFARTEDKKILMPAFKKGLYVSGGLLVLFFIMYIMFDYLSGTDERILSSANSSGNTQLIQMFSSFFEGLKEDRKGLMMGSILRYIGFGAAVSLLIFLLIRKSISTMLMGIVLIALSLIDIFTIDVKYLNYENYKEKDENETPFVKTKFDNEILADKSFFRIFNVSGDPFSDNIPSYYYNSTGGYHPAKIAIYQELIENQLSKGPQNRPVFDMLNTKYFMQKDGNGQTQAIQKNDSALGNCWLVKAIQYVKDPNEEMKALDNFNPKDTAIVQESFKTSIPLTPVADSNAVIQLVKNDNDVVNYTFNAATNQFAVFSEIYYTAGWKAYIDGKEAPIVKVDYVLRGLSVPAGKHEIKFEFKPQGYYTGRKMTSIFSIVLLVLLAAGLFMEWRNRKQTTIANRA